ncbi:InlB B-repeat-containing protein [Tenacibaculum maritimum]|uniref:InlB B-repeat-containing protein n=1 Tax=Tenacibaculum maritimum TaxID=107401 RepID=UPI001E3526BE|nr:T9SS type A sorting domain-containing protein [Tenacibaculum maritimum]MCD9583527.1 T9SS type A sorting domain-containing protein [Tenacibaculum maritimum]MCD9620354.1 T9SS type A sorting domain-containing protein [Tenacibaculum maritimum]MCD9627961.1 T9SS type A sorting domain-containing protein [Tenacibaculum maritimum]MCD9629959.1 T9SS type A sorting domain-containing protein [Tenacibaculum maritimum]MCD9633101.1 T9SS type A sorting domain-containing protein [Tenacibaculum maritimum]
MKKITLILLCFGYFFSGFAQNHLDGQTIINIPDPNFKAYLVANKRINTNNDNEIQKSEANNFTGKIYLNGKLDEEGNYIRDLRNDEKVSDLTGIEHFKKLKFLALQSNLLKTLDISKNTALEVLNCSSNQLKTLDISKNTALEVLYCGKNQLTRLDISHNNNLKKLSCRVNKLSELNLTNNTKLESLFCEANKLRELDLSKNLALTFLYCTDNQLTRLNTSNNPQLAYLFCGSNNIVDINTQHNPLLIRLDCSRNKLTTLDVSDNKELETFFCSYNALETLDLSQNKKLAYSFYCDNNKLSSLNIKNGNNHNLKNFEAHNNPNLLCIQVDDVNLANGQSTDLWMKGRNAKYKNNCNTFNFTVNINDKEGKINTTPALIDDSYDKGTVVTLEAIPNTGYEFSEWAGDVTGKINPLNVTVNADKNITAIFKKTQHTLTINANNGAVTIGTSTIHLTPSSYPSNEVFEYNTSVSLHAVPNSGYRFVRWLGDIDNDHVSTSIKIVINKHKSITAVFEKEPVVYIPDPNFKAYLIKNPFINTNNDDEIQVTEATKYSEYIYIPNREQSESKKIKDLTGIEAFINLTELNCNYNLISQLNLSKNTKLKRVHCSNNKLASLNIGSNLVLEELYVDNNQITNLDTSNALNLIKLAVNSNQISTIDLSKNLDLKDFSCSNNQLTELSTIHNKNLEWLLCKNNQLTNLDLSGMRNLVVADCSNNQIADLTISNTPKLKDLSCAYNQLNSLDLSKIPSLDRLDCNDNKISELDFSSNKNLTSVACSNNLLVKLNIKNGHNENINYVSIWGNSDLACIQVDDENAIPNSWHKDAIAQYSTNCNATAGIDDVFTSKLSIYPNPVNGILRILSPYQDIENVRIFNMVGQKILQTDQLTINCNELSKGVYIVKIKSTDNKTGVKKFIKN